MRFAVVGAFWAVAQLAPGQNLLTEIQADLITKWAGSPGPCLEALRTFIEAPARKPEDIVQNLTVNDPPPLQQRYRQAAIRGYFPAELAKASPASLNIPSNPASMARTRVAEPSASADALFLEADRELRELYNSNFDQTARAWTAHNQHSDLYALYVLLAAENAARVPANEAEIQFRMTLFRWCYKKDPQRLLNLLNPMFPSATA
jgi:hypothetical protein